MSNASAIRAGRAMVEIGVNRKGFDRELSNVARTWETFGKQVQAIARPFAIASTAALSAAGAAVGAFASVGDQLDEMSQRTGASVEALSGLAYGAKLAGTDLETVEAGMRNLGKVVTEAAAGSESAAKSIAAIGLSAADLQGIRPEQQFRLIADGLASISDPGARATAALELLGKSGTKLLPLLQNGASGLDAMQKRAEELGLVMSGGAAKAAAELSDAIDEVKLTIKAVTVAVGAALAPHIRTLVRDIAETVGEITRWIQRNNAAAVAAANFAASIAKVAVPLYAIGKATSFAGSGLTKLQSMLEKVTALSTAMSKAGGATGAPTAAGAADSFLKAATGAGAMAVAAQHAYPLWTSMAKSTQSAATAASAATPAMTTAAAATQNVGNAAKGTAASLGSVITKFGMYAAALQIAIAEFTIIVTTVQSVSDYFYKYDAKISDAAEKRREEGDRARAADLKSLEVLKRMAGQHKKTAQETAIATNLIGRLRAKYGDLGLTAESTAEQIERIAAAIEDQARALRLAELNKEIDEIRKNIAELDKEMESNVLNSGTLRWNGYGQDFDPADRAYARQAEEIADRRMEQMKKLAAVNQQTLDFRRGRGSVTGDDPAGEAAVQKATTAAETYGELMRRIRDLQIEMIEDGLRRSIAAINSKYDHEKSEAIKANADKDTLLAIERARELELDNKRIESERRITAERIGLTDELNRARIEGIEDEYERERELLKLNAKIRKRELEKTGSGELASMVDALLAENLKSLEAKRQQRAADDASAEAERILAANDEQRQRNRELKIRATMSGPERDIALKQLEAEQRLAEAKKMGIDPALVGEQNALEMQILLQEIRQSAADMFDRSEAIGTFNAAAVAGFGAGGAPDERTARAVEQMLRVLQGMDRRGGLFVN